VAYLITAIVYRMHFRNPSQGTESEPPVELYLQLLDRAAETVSQPTFVTYWTLASLAVMIAGRRIGVCQQREPS